MRLVAILNQKGGVGKTTTAVNLGAALALEGKNVLLVDLDPQGNLTDHLGVEVGADTPTIYDLMDLPEEPLNLLPIDALRPSKDKLAEINASFM